MSKKKQPPDAAWIRRLEKLRDGRTYTSIGAKCGWEPWRAEQIMQRGSMPNVVDAILLGAALGVSVYDIWAEDAADQLLPLGKQGAAVLERLKACAGQAFADAVERRRMRLALAGKRAGRPEPRTDPPGRPGPGNRPAKN